MAGPIFNIRPTRAIDREVVAMVAANARQMRANFMQQQQLALQQQRFAAQQQMQERNFKLQEDNLALERDQLELARKKQEDYAKELESRQTARTARSEQGAAKVEQSRIQNALRFYGMLTKDEQTSIKNANESISRKVSQFPLEDNEYDLTEFQGKSAQQIASIVTMREKSLSGVDEWTMQEHESLLESGQGGLDKVLVLQRHLQAAQRALQLRKQQHGEYVQSQGIRETNNPIVLNNLMYGLEADIAGRLGLVQPGAQPEGGTGDKSGDIDAAADKPSVEPPTSAPKPEEGAADAAPQAQAPATSDALHAQQQLAGQITDLMDNGMHDQAREAYAKAKEQLDDEAVVQLFMQLEAAHGEELARDIIFRR